MGPTRPTYPEELMFVERASGEAEPATGSHRGGWREALLAGVRRALQTGGETAAASAWDPDEVLERELAQNSRSWAALRGLGVEEGAELPLRFCFDSAGPEADGALAEFFRREAGYHVVIEREGVSGRTAPMTLGQAALDAWVAAMVRAGHDHSGCPFSGWTATTKAGRT